MIIDKVGEQVGSPPYTTSNQIITPPWEKGLTVILCLYFIAKLFYFAFNIAPGIPPDEMTHIGVVELYAHGGLRIQDNADSYPLGLVTRTPNFYFLVLGTLSRANIFSVDPIYFLRTINIVFSIGTLWFALLLMRRFTTDAVTRLLFLAMFTNTLMFTFLGAAVSYDNLVNLLAVLSLFSMVEFIKKQTPVTLLTFALWPLIGALTKISFLPLGLLLLIVILVERKCRIFAELKALGYSIAKRRPAVLVLAALVATALLANVMLYGVNIVRYHKLIPSCDQVLDLDVCMEYRIFAKDWIVGQYRSNNLSLSEAMEKTLLISHPGDRDHALRLLRNEQQYQTSPPKPIPVWDYMHAVWMHAMKPSIFGIQAHYSMLRDPWQMLPFNLILFAAFVLWLRGLSLSPGHRLSLLFSAIVLGYFLILVGWYNYTNYIRSHAMFYGVQGRYIFPVLVPAYLVIAQALACRQHGILRSAFALVVAIIFLLGDLPFFVSHASAGWFGNPT